MSLVDLYLKSKFHPILIECNFPTLSNEALNYILTSNSSKTFDVTTNGCRFYEWNKERCLFVVEANIYSTSLGQLERNFRKIFMDKFFNLQAQLSFERNADNLELELSSFLEARDFDNFELTIKPWTILLK